MATTATRPASVAPGEGIRALGGTIGPPAPAALGVALALAILYAAFAGGAGDVVDGSRLQVGIAAISLGAVAALLFGGLRAAARPPAVAALGLLVAFAAWSGLSIAWSVAPGESWVELNRTIVYALAVGLGILLGASLPRARERVAVGYLVLATLVALYALGGKALPWVELPGIFDLNHSERIARLNEPLGYWNALAMFLVLGVPIALRSALAAERSRLARAAAVASLVLLLTAIVLTYSSGGLVVLAAAFALQAALAHDRPRLLLVAGAALVGCAPAALAGLLLGDLTEAGVAELARANGGAVFLVLLLLGAAGAALLANLGLRDERTRAASRTSGLVALAACVLALVALVGLAGVTESRKDSTALPVVGEAPAEDAPSRLARTDSSNRWEWWGEAIGAAWDQPLEGHGAGSFPLVHRRYRDDRQGVRRAHSAPLEFLAETGLVGGALALGGLGLLGVAAARGASRRSEEPGAAWATALLAGAAAWGVHLFIDWDWEIPAVTLPALLFLGVLAATPHEARRPSTAWRGRPSTSAGPFAYGLLLALAAALLSVVATSAVLPALARERADDAAAAAGAARTPTELDEAARKAAAAERLDPLSVEGLLAGAAVAERQRRYSYAGDLLLKAAERQPENPEVWAELGRLQLLFGNAPGAYESSQRGFALDPFSSVFSFIAQRAALDARASASAIGTPLPLERPKPPAPPDRGTPPAPPPSGGQAPPSGDTPPAGPPPATPAPGAGAPAPAPAPQPP